ncbi:OVARIAN TUMOR DOMAIN-containing deubiquitinating enzyme 6 [Nicotiana tabacum]|uniref:OTU domain-containing protein 5-B n=1 Tax=Nicotiana tabacum TaxID=4097 RepID=A0A1S4BTC6_TOBAC|nr:PREDICTED: OTU domain-containing protein 5-B-like [Nicotiana tabacum]XP_016492035.1 PREDICTED: OTU domain-containing protein 5-B-like [Nicotiana tabacum]XP_016492042.1 PREDICTED: OTU domain-containing protein 5-B-like [Nicotiana tabacum]XP_016492048.1 PREDICTED: OTU domain-containing protein 5-B-like [Nicotiana tabacum]XP_016492055.1 PREDICTED: OTU domain-containing protein 5-B-like [Nicotiana tabacum]
MTRILVQRGSAGASSSSSSNQNRSSTSLPGSSSSSAPTQPQASSNSQVLSASKDDEFVEEIQEEVALEELSIGSSNYKGVKVDDGLLDSLGSDQSTIEEKIADNETRDGVFVSEGLAREYDGLRVVEVENEGSSVQRAICSSCPPPPPVPPPKPASLNSSPRRFPLGSSHAGRIGSSRGTAGRPTVSTRTSPAGSRPSSPRSHCDEGYNSADEQNPSFGSSYDDVEREQQFEMDLRRTKGLEVKKMLEDGNCLFRAVADQVYGDSEAYDLVRQMCIDYMERERDHFSQFITEGFTSYCKRKRRDKVYGNNVEIQALCEMYNRPIHIYSYSTEPINTFHGSYNTDSPPIRLSYHHGNHYNSLVDPRRLTVGAGLGFSSLQGRNVDKDQVKAAIKAQQDQQIDNALLAEGRFYSDLELTEKEIERMVMEASRAEYIANDKFRQQFGCRESSTSSAEPSSSGARSSGSEAKQEGGGREVLSDCIQIMLSMGFSYARVIEAYSIFGDDVDSMVCYLIETSSSSRRKGKATE